MLFLSIVNYTSTIRVNRWRNKKKTCTDDFSLEKKETEITISHLVQCCFLKYYKDVHIYLTINLLKFIIINEYY